MKSFKYMNIIQFIIRFRNFKHFLLRKYSSYYNNLQGINFNKIIILQYIIMYLCVPTPFDDEDNTTII